MEKVITDELTKTLILLGMGVAGSFVVLAKIISRLYGSFKPYTKATIGYLLVAFLLFSLISILSYWSYLQSQQLFYLIYEAYFLLLGIAHVNWLGHYLKWAGKEKSLLAELLFTLIISMLGSIGFVCVHRIFDHPMELNMAGSIIWFVIPWFVNQTSLNALDIPSKILKRWFYPVSGDIEEPEENKLKNLLLVSFLIRKQNKDLHETHFRAKAPVDMEFGELFYYFINDYNEGHPQEKIEFVDGTGEPFGWVFYEKPKHFALRRKYIDGEKTIFNNGIRENNVIVCKRISYP